MNAAFAMSAGCPLFPGSGTKALTASSYQRRYSRLTHRAWFPPLSVGTDAMMLREFGTSRWEISMDQQAATGIGLICFFIVGAAAYFATIYFAPNMRDYWRDKQD